MRRREAAEPPVELNDQDMLNDLLLGEKHLIQMLTQAEANCANRTLREALHQMHDETEQLHVRCFHAALTRGWHRTPTADRNAIEELIILWEQRPEREPELRPSGR